MVAARRGRGGVGAVICISIILTIFAIKIVGTAGNAIRNSDDHQNMMRIIINDTDSGTTTRGIRTNSSSSGDSSSIPSRPQNHHHHHLPPGQQQQLSHSSATDANRTLLAGGGGAAVVVVAPSSSSSSLSSWAGRAASYSYFYIGRKLIYVPLFFLLYWTVYNIVLLGQSIASRWVSARMGSACFVYHIHSCRTNLAICLAPGNGNNNIVNNNLFIGINQFYSLYTHPQVHVPQHWPAPTYVEKVRRKRNEDAVGIGPQYYQSPRGSQEIYSSRAMDHHVGNAVNILEAIYNFQFKLHK